MTAARPADTAGRLAELEALHAAATPGPWVLYEAHGRDWCDEAWSFLGIRSMTGKLPQVAQTHPLTMDGESDLAREDAALIVAAVNAVPELVAAVRGVLALCDEDQFVCTCYPSGVSPASYEGPQKWCPVHGRALADRIRAAVASALDRGTE